MPKEFQLSGKANEFILWAKQLDSEPMLQGYLPFLAIVAKWDGKYLKNASFVFSQDAQTMTDKDIIKMIREMIDKWEAGIINSQGFTKIIF